MNNFKLIIAGSRSFCSYAAVQETVDKLLVNKTKDNLIEIVSGAAQGPDTIGRAYALEKGYRISVMEANWDAEGKSAGMRRNERMADYADAAVVFWDGYSVGTKNMIKCMVQRNKPIRVVHVDTINQCIITTMNPNKIVEVE